MVIYNTISFHLAMGLAFQREWFVRDIALWNFERKDV